MIRKILKYWREIIIGGLIILMILFFNCEGSKENTQTVDVVVPEKTGEVKDPVAIVSHDNGKDTIVYNNKTIITENPVNKKLAQELLDALKDKDSLKVVNMYLKSIEEHEQTRTFDDKDVTVDVRTKTRGVILEQDIKWTRKEHTIKAEVPLEKDNFGTLLSGEAKQNLNNQQTNFEIGVGVRIKKMSFLVKGNTNKEVGIQLIKEF